MTQGKVGRLVNYVVSEWLPKLITYLQLQVSPPHNTNRLRRRHDNDGDSDVYEVPQLHSSISALALPTPDPSSTISSVFGTARSEADEAAQHLYAAQIAALLHTGTSSASGDTGKSSTSGDSTEVLDTKNKPAIVGFGLKSHFFEEQADENARRDRFVAVMQLVKSVL